MNIRRRTSAMRVNHIVNNKWYGRNLKIIITEIIINYILTKYYVNDSLKCCSFLLVSVIQICYLEKTNLLSRVNKFIISR